MKKIFIGIIASSLLTLTSYADKKHNGSNGDHVAGKHQKQNNRHHDKHGNHKHNKYHSHNKHHSKIITTKKIIHHQPSRHINNHYYSHQHSQKSSYGISIGYSNHSRSGHYEYINKKIWIPARCEKIWVPARYEYRRGHCGKFIRVQVCKGYYRSHTVPGYYDYRTVKVWKPANCQPRNSFSFYWGR